MNHHLMKFATAMTFTTLLGGPIHAFAAGLTCERVFTAAAYGDYKPVSFLDLQVQKVVQRIENEGGRTDFSFHDVDLKLRAKRDEIMNIYYQRNLVEASEITLLLSDKLVMAKILEKYLGPRFTEFHPPTMGLKEFLIKNKLVNANGVVKADRLTLEKALDSAFPQGFIIKPPVGWGLWWENFL